MNLRALNSLQHFGNARITCKLRLSIICHVIKLFLDLFCVLIHRFFSVLILFCY